MVRFRKGPDETDQEILQTAQADGKGVTIRLRQDPGAAGKRDAAHLTRLLAGFTVKVEAYAKTEGNKVLRARPMASQVNQGNFRAMRGPWWGAFKAELLAFPRGKNDDQIDAAADGFEEVTQHGGWATDPRALERLRGGLV